MRKHTINVYINMRKMVVQNWLEKILLNKH